MRTKDNAYNNLRDWDFLSQRATQPAVSMDTIRASAAGTLRPDIVAALDSENWQYITGNWKITRKDRPGSHGGRFRTFEAVRRHPYLYVYGRDNQIQKVLCHLPEILHGYNGIQIKTQAELDMAVEKTNALVEEILSTPVRFMEFRRIDFAYNLPCPLSRA